MVVVIILIVKIMVVIVVLVIVLIVIAVLKYPEAVAQRCSVKKVFLEISQNSQETPVPEYLSFLTKLQASHGEVLILIKLQASRKTPVPESLSF